MAEPPEDWTEHLGSKVSIRYRIQGDPDHSFSEAVGVVQSATEDADGRVVVTIVDRRGSVVAVDAADVTAAKVFRA